jgi:hypothetical protein
MSSSHIPVYDICASLDTIGLAGFGHDFRVLADEDSSVFNALKDMELAKKSSTDFAMFILHMRFGSVNPILTDRQKCMRRFRNVCGTLAKSLLEKMRQDKNERSIIARLGGVSRSFLSAKTS